MAKILDPLEMFLKQAKKERHERAVASPPCSPSGVPDRQADREWSIGQTLALLHRADDGTETALGIFTEYLREGSRWLRPTADTLSTGHVEIVTGSWWLSPRIREIPVDSVGEVAAIRSRFEMLMSEFEQLYNLEPVMATPKTLEEIEELEEELEIEDEDEDDFEDDDLDEDEEDE